MEELKVIARFKIHDGKLEEFKNWASTCKEAVQQKDPGTLEYDWYFNNSQTECVVRETYSDSNAVMAHMGNLGELLAQGTELADLSLEIYGDPSEELSNAAAGLNPAVYSYFQGL